MRTIHASHTLQVSDWMLDGSNLLDRQAELKMTTPYEEVTILRRGDAAPAFTLAAYPEGKVSLSDFAGSKNVILAFYPKDDTPGCTKEMCGFSDNLKQFEDMNTVVFGVSCDSTDSHNKFAGKYGLNVTLLSDSTKEVGRKFGAVRGDRNMADRILFIIDKNGVIQHVISGMPDLADVAEKVKSLG
ncbi:MAG: peroxiredoxin [Cyanobacteria bacterium]|nr:peroxiredoxin [Cyanobacteriota bacterium]